MLNSSKIGAYISQQRKNKNLTQAELAEKLNITHQAISKWENGSSLPDVGILVELAELFEITVDEILKGESNEVIEEKKEMNNEVERNTNAVKAAIRANCRERTTSLSEAWISVIENPIILSQ